MSGDGFEDIDGLDEVELVYEVCDVDAAHPQWSEVRAEVNYVAAWRRARLAGVRLRALLCRADVPVERAVRARVRGDGSAVVCLELEMASAAALAELLDAALRERQEGAAVIRGAPSRRVA
jgi:hypothetical protein